MKALEDKFRFTDYWGPRLYDARGNLIDWPNRPRIRFKTGRTMQFYRNVNREAAEALGLKRLRPDPEARFHYRQDRAKMPEFTLEKKGVKSAISGGVLPDHQKNGGWKRLKKTKDLRESVKRFSWLGGG